MKRVMPSFVLLLLIVSTISTVQPNNKLVLGTVANLPPFSYYENGKLCGIDIEVINALGKQMGMDIEIKPMPWLRVKAEVEKGTIDGAFSLYMNDNRKKTMDYIAVVHYDNLGLLTKKGSEFDYTGIQSLHGRVIGKGAGVYISDEFDQAVDQGLIRVEEINDTEMGNIHKIISGRLDTVIGIAETMRFYARQLNCENQVTTLNTLIERQRPGYLVISKKSRFIQDTKFIAKLSRGINRIMGSDVYAELSKKYLRANG